MNISLPIEIKVDNMGALYLAQNGCGKRTRYIDSRHHFVYDYVENGEVKVVFIPTLENASYPFTKILQQQFTTQIPVVLCIAETMKLKNET